MGVAFPNLLLRWKLGYLAYLRAHTGAPIEIQYMPSYT
jgi:hypothetical protein